jgi:hypothetical protein
VACRGLNRVRNGCAETFNILTTGQNIGFTLYCSAALIVYPEDLP